MLTAAVKVLAIFTRVFQSFGVGPDIVNVCKGKRHCAIRQIANNASSMLQLPLLHTQELGNGHAIGVGLPVISAQVSAAFVSKSSKKNEANDSFPPCSFNTAGMRRLIINASLRQWCFGYARDNLNGLSECKAGLLYMSCEGDFDYCVEGTVTKCRWDPTDSHCRSDPNYEHCQEITPAPTLAPTPAPTLVPTSAVCNFMVDGMRRLVVNTTHRTWCAAVTDYGAAECNRSYISCEAYDLDFCTGGTVSICAWDSLVSTCSINPDNQWCVSTPSPAPTVVPTPAPTPVNKSYQMFLGRYCQPWTEDGGNGTVTTVEACLWLCLTMQNCVAISWFPTYDVKCYLFDICPSSGLGNSIYDSETYIKLNQALFTFDGTPRDYQQSAQYCQSQGRVIASIRDAEEQKQVELLLTTSAYLGAIGDNRYSWSWVDGTPWGFTPPSIGLKGTQLSIDADGSWKALTSGTDLLGVVCRFVVQTDLHYCGWTSSSRGGSAAYCGLQSIAGNGCTLSDCKGLEDCITKCNGCPSCRGFTYKPDGGDGYRCLMQQEMNHDGQFMAKQPDKSRWWAYVNDRDPMCMASPTPIPPTPLPTEVQQVYETNQTWLSISMPRGNRNVDEPWYSVLTGDMTWEGWFRVTSVPTHMTTMLGSHVLDDLGDDYSRGGHRRRHGSVFITADGDIFLETNVGKAESHWVAQGIDGSSTNKTKFADAFWHHVAIVWDRAGGVGHLYLDATLVGSVEYEFNDIVDDLVAIDGSIVFGGGLCADHDPGGMCSVRRTLECEISQLRIWTRTFTNAELRTCALMAPSELNLFVLYRLIDDLDGLAIHHIPALRESGGTGGTFVRGHAAQPCATPSPTPAPSIAPTGPPGCEEDTEGKCDEGPCFTWRGNTTCSPDFRCLCTNWPDECAEATGILPFFFAKACKPRDGTKASGAATWQAYSVDMSTNSR